LGRLSNHRRDFRETQLSKKRPARRLAQREAFRFAMDTGKWGKGNYGTAEGHFLTTSPVMGRKSVLLMPPNTYEK
jgi:hypothetical protein